MVTLRSEQMRSEEIRSEHGGRSTEIRGCYRRLLLESQNGEGDSPNIKKALVVKNFRTMPACVFCLLPPAVTWHNLDTKTLFLLVLSAVS